MNRLIVFLLFSVACQSVWSDPAFGDWWTEDRDAVVRLSPDGDSIQGRIIWLESPYHESGHERAGEPVLDEENPEPEMQDKPVLGMTILWGFERHEEGEWRDGSVYDPENGRTYRARLRMDDDRLRLRGYVGRPIFGRSSQWERLETELPEDHGAIADFIDKD